MIRPKLLVLAVLLLLVDVSAAHADRVWTVRATTVHAAPSDQSRRVQRIGANKPLTVLTRRGRWLKILHGSKTGWITRNMVRGDRPVKSRSSRRRGMDKERAAALEATASVQTAALAVPGAKTVVAPEAPQTGPEAGTDACKGRTAWCGQNKQGSSMRMLALVDSLRAFEQPGTDQRVLFTVGRKDELIVMGRDRDKGWYLIQSPKGEIGWVPAASVRDKADRPNARLAAAAAVTALPVVAAPAPAEPKPAAFVRTASPVQQGQGHEDTDRLQAKVAVGTGFASVGRLLIANQGESGYLATAQGVAGTVDASAHYQASGPVHVGVDASYALVTGISGLRVQNSDGSIANTDFFAHQAEIAVCAGYERRVGVFVRAGVGLEAFEVPESLDPGTGARLPRERLTALLLGLELSVPRMLGALSAQLRGDMQVGSRAQTPGLEDGMAVESSLGARAQLSALYPIAGRFYVDGSYVLHMASTAWSGPSSRDPLLADSQRTDQTHSLTLGLGARF